MSTPREPASVPALPGARRARREDIDLLRKAFHPLRKRLAAVSVLAVATALMEAVIMLCVASLAGTLVDGNASTATSVAGERVEMSRGALCAVLVGLVVVRAVLDFLLAELKARTEGRYDARTRRRVARSYLRADWALQSTELAGGLQASVVTFVSQARTLLTKFTDSIVALVSLLVMLAASMKVAGLATLAVIGVMVLVAVGLRPFIGANRRASIAQRDSSRTFSNQILEMVSLSRDIKLLGIRGRIEEQVSSEIGELASATQSSSAASYRLQSLHATITLLALAGGLIALVAIGGSDAERYAAMVLLLYRAMTYGRALQVTYQGVVGSLPYLEELEERIERYDASEEHRGSVELAEPVRSVRFNDVTFGYTPGTEALSGIDFAFEAGDAIGIVGPSGAGKSTLVQLLLGLRRPTSGTITMNDVDGSEISAESWARHTSFVAQDPTLFRGSVIDNVIGFRDRVSHDQAIEALRAAHVLDDMVALPEGLATDVGEMGKRLSGGQRQRVCIARALAGQPDLLVLDEPTSALDLASEDAIRETLEGIKGHITLVIVAHRMSTLRVCDQVLVVDNGKVEAFGDREDLEHDNPYYAEAIRLAKLV